MNDSKPNTQAQRDVDKILQDARDKKGQKEIDAIVNKMDAKNQSAPANIKNDSSPKASPTPESKIQGEDNDYYNGMSQ